jgi:lysophospholipase L1-like esterase
MGPGSLTARKTLVFLGDSLTEFFDWQRRFPRFRVLNLGIAGEPVEGLLDRMDEVLSSMGGPDFLFLMTGINNIAADDYDFIGPYRKILSTLCSSFRETTVVVQSILPVALPWVDNKAIERTNVQLKELAKECNADYLDLSPFFFGDEGIAVAESLLDDGVHLSPRGYEMWSKAVEDFISAKA